MNQLWKYYHNEDVDKFRHLLSNGNSAAHTLKGYGSLVGSPGGFGTSPRNAPKNRKVSGQAGTFSGVKGTSTTLGRAEINSRDHAGLTILHRAASSTSENATSFAMALLEHPSIDLYVQDAENGWTALHRALYFGNITLARAIIEKDNRDPTSQMGNAAQRAVSSVIKVKDYEGNSPFDVYNATIARRSLQTASEALGSDDGSDDTDSVNAGINSDVQLPHAYIDGDEVFAWGSSRNHGLGFKDQDDRQHPEKITLKRPDHLLFRFYREYVESVANGDSSTKLLPPTPKSVSDLPTLISNRPIVIQDIAVSKLHSAILTTDPESNLYMCGFGPGARLGTGDETTRFSYTPIEEGALSGKKVIKVALGQNHSLAVTSEGSLLSWGTNTYGQLGYTLPRPALKDEEPVCAIPRQIFGPLKREMITGVAASAIHSVAHTSTSLFTWGKNEGQLGLMDSDSRSLETQPVPRKVAASLFKAAINMVSAINTATIVLLANHSVCVFTNYGYNIVKFPLYESFTNYHLQSNALTTRYESASNHISHITAGGDTIGALSSRGDLFTVTVRGIPTTSASSTTNPSKIKDSLSPPQRVWSLRKGNWDGIKSVGITENGSVIVCTQAGAVWRRIKRIKIKDAHMGSGNLNRKDFKFQRVPGLTKVAAVRSTTFGVYAAVRKDCDVTRTQILVDEQALWDDMAPLLSIHDLEASEPPQEEEDTESRRYWAPAFPKEHFEPLKRAVLTSPDLELDVAQHLLGENLDGYDMEIGSTSSEVFIPVHGFMLGRSPVLRKLLEESRSSGIASISEVLTVFTPDDLSVSSSGHGRVKTRIVFQGLDFITIMNFAVYLYTDSVIDVWHFIRHSPRMSFRYRQVRVELMKTASQLKLGKLESAVRLMTETERRMNVDFSAALQDPNFFSDGDTIIELNGSESVVHSALLCQRCPFFQGLFHGRAGGQWLAGRRESGDDVVRIDLKHVQPDTFQLVLRYLYADVGTELFDNVVSADIDELSELVLDVMGVANELMLDRLSQICQEVIGRFVTTRNVCQLLNLIGPCSVTRFKDAALEYLCLQLESMLENHLLTDLDEDLLLELDEVVRANQLNCLPFAKSGRAELLLHERHPSLAEDILEERQRRLRDMAFRATLKDDESKLSSSYRARIGSLEDLISASPTQDRSRQKSKAARNAPFSPSLRPKDSTIDLMFDMDDDEQLAAGSSVSPGMRPTATGRSPASPKPTWDEPEPRSVPDDEILSLPLRTPPSSFRPAQAQSASSPKIWSSPSLPSSKLDMREIMAQTSSTRTSNLSMSISAEKAKDEAIGRQGKAKISQKERKKQQQQIMQQMISQPQIALDKGDGKPASPWQVASTGAKTSLKDVLADPQSSPSNIASKHLESPAAPRSLTPRRTASPDTRFSGQQRSVSGNSIGKGYASSSARSMSQPQASIVPHSKSYTTPAMKAEPSLQLSMADIIGQQRREQEVIKEAVAKRSLQEIQEEQAFQEWWDQESRRAQEEEAARTKNSGSVSGRGSKSGGRAKSGGRGLGGRGRGYASRGRGGGRGKEKAAST